MSLFPLPGVCLQIQERAATVVYEIWIVLTVAMWNLPQSVFAVLGTNEFKKVSNCVDTTFPRLRPHRQSQFLPIDRVKKIKYRNHARDTFV